MEAVGQKKICAPSNGTSLLLKVYLSAYSSPKEYLLVAQEVLAGFGIDNRPNGRVDMILPRNNFRVVLVRIRCAAESQKAERELAMRAIKTKTVVRVMWRYPEGGFGSDDVHLDS